MRSSIVLSILVAFCFIDNGLCCGKGKKKGLQNPLQPAAEPEPVIQRMLGKDVVAAPYAAGPDQPGDCSQLTCNLDSSESCCWTNALPPADQLSFVKGSGATEPAKVQSSFGTSTAPDGNFFVTASENAGTTEQSAQLYSCPISCANGDITVSVKHWQSKGTKIQVCSEKDPAGPPENCQDLPLTSGNADTVTIPKGENVRIVIQAKGFTEPTGTVAVVDDITVTCDPCPGTTQATPAPPGVTTVPPPVGAPPCKEITCNFESGNPCSYTPATGGGTATENWGAHEVVYQNRLTGISKPSGEGQKFGACYLKKKGEKSTLESTASFDKDYVVSYKYYKATEGISFKACCDDESKCPKDSTGAVQTADFKAWKTEAVNCPAGTKKVLFICDNAEGTSEGACGVDDIKLLQSTGGDPHDASTPAC